MPLYTFFEEYDFSGKTIIPFVSHGGSSFSGTIRTIQSLEPDATVINELPVALECKLIKVLEGSMYLAQIVNVVADEKSSLHRKIFTFRHGILLDMAMKDF